MDARRTGNEALSNRATSQYVSEDFQSLSAAARELEGLRRSGQWSRMLVAAGRRRRAIWRGLRALRQLDRLDLPLTATPTGEAIRRSVQSRSTRVARAVLELPDDRARYHRGRSRQALRTNVRHAEELGITCHELPAARKTAALDELLDSVDCIGPERSRLGETVGLAPSRQEFHAAVDAAGDVIALAVLEVDVRCARLVYLRAVGRELGGPARYALSLHVIHSLIDRRVRLLLVGGAVRLAPGLQYFQQRLGFGIFNLRPVPAGEWQPKKPGRVRLVMAAIVAFVAKAALLGPALSEDVLETLIPVEVRLPGVALAYFLGHGA